MSAEAEAIARRDAHLRALPTGQLMTAAIAAMIKMGTPLGETDPALDAAKGLAALVAQGLTPSGVQMREAAEVLEELSCIYCHEPRSADLAVELFRRARCN